MLLRLTKKCPPFLFVGVVVFVAATIGISSRYIGQLAQIWPANALLLWLMITYPLFSQKSCWISASAGFLLAGWVMSDPLFVNIWLATANLAGVSVGYALFRRLERQEKELDGPQSVLALLLVCSGAAAAAALVGTGIAFSLPGSTPWGRFILWFSSELNRYLVLLPVCFAGKKWFSDLVQAGWRSVLSAQSFNIAPIVSLAASVVLATLTGGPGAIAFPVPALLWCALTYSVLPMCLVVLIFNVTVMGIVEAGLLNFHQTNETIGVTVSFRLGLSFLVLGPLTVAAIMNTQRALVARLNQSITWDSLTHVLSRQAYLERSADLIKNVRETRKDEGVAILMLDLDRFKDINDTYGHFTGDAALVAVSAAISDVLCAEQIFGRVGGEEFAITIAAIDENMALGLAEKIRQTVENVSCFISDVGLQMTVSIGVVYRKEADVIDFQSLLTQADAALYAAKTAGRNCVMKYSDLNRN
ncbi:diguanylate cyclase [Gluconobacter cerinus]|uniref:sensor domain-containing diguanylate cyclase n=1 Tax=Gluconobacter cerinus TaxID=38307 RepID=UPI001B8AD075|nr:GGDEF domain-containing protein [Gluconobacter cerinus]MBS1018943.1 diguanylate cyclase [Gluconobacter cerinus]